MPAHMCAFCLKIRTTILDEAWGSARTKFAAVWIRNERGRRLMGCAFRQAWIPRPGERNSQGPTLKKLCMYLPWRMFPGFAHTRCAPDRLGMAKIVGTLGRPLRGPFNRTANDRNTKNCQENG